MPKLVVGLGNPGREYDGTRHNIGFAVLDALAERQGSSFKRKWRLATEMAEVVSHGSRLWLAKPRTYMNRSGLAVAAVIGWFKLVPSDLLVVADDADLPLGQIRIRASGGSGGHNGLHSIIQALGNNEEFARLRVGIGRIGPVGADLTGHVLGRFGAEESATAEQAVTMAVRAIECCRQQGLTAAMNQFNRKRSDENRREEEEC